MKITVLRRIGYAGLAQYTDDKAPLLVANPSPMSCCCTNQSNQGRLAIRVSARMSATACCIVASEVETAELT